MAARTKVLIMGAAGRDFHNFNTYFRDNEQFEIVAFVAKLFVTLLPVLDHFNIQAAVATGRQVPLAYLGWAALYCLLYSTVAMLVALLLFEDRDLA